MQLFHSDYYVETSVGDYHEISTPLGVLAPRVFVNDTEVAATPCDRAYSCRERDAIILQWVRAECVVEILIVPYPLLDMPTIHATCAIIRIKVLSANVLVNLAISWRPGYCWRTFDSAQSGERLEACTWENSDWKVTVGTEDNEQLGGRSHQGEYMPRRLSIALHKDYKMVGISRQGVEINLPLLHTGELVQVQFSIATGPNKGEEDEDIDTWLAVDYAGGGIPRNAGCT